MKKPMVVFAIVFVVLASLTVLSYYEWHSFPAWNEPTLKQIGSGDTDRQSLVVAVKKADENLAIVEPALETALVSLATRNVPVVTDAISDVDIKNLYESLARQDNLEGQLQEIAKSHSSGKIDELLLAILEKDKPKGTDETEGSLLSPTLTAHLKDRIALECERRLAGQGLTELRRLVSSGRFDNDANSTFIESAQWCESESTFKPSVDAEKKESLISKIADVTWKACDSAIKRAEEERLDLPKIKDALMDTKVEATWLNVEAVVRSNDSKNSDSLDVKPTEEQRLQEKKNKQLLQEFRDKYPNSKFAEDDAKKLLRRVDEKFDWMELQLALPQLALDEQIERLHDYFAKYSNAQLNPNRLNNVATKAATKLAAYLKNTIKPITPCGEKKIILAVGRNEIVGSVVEGNKSDSVIQMSVTQVDGVTLNRETKSYLRAGLDGDPVPTDLHDRQTRYAEGRSKLAKSLARWSVDDCEEFHKVCVENKFLPEAVDARILKELVAKCSAFQQDQVVLAVPSNQAPNPP